MKNTVLVIGAEVAKHYSDAGYRVLGVSRRPAAAAEWIQADIATSEGLQHLFAQIGRTPINALLFIAGVWEENAFTEAFDFRKSSVLESRQLISVNLVAPIEITKALSKNLSSTPNLDVAVGDTLLLIGPRGCGKSILLCLIAGLIRPDTAAITFDGTVIIRANIL